jgi:hypothetical protein
MAAKLTRLTQKIAIQPHLVAESCTICSSRSRRPVWTLLESPSYFAKVYLRMGPDRGHLTLSGFVEARNFLNSLKSIFCSKKTLDHEVISWEGFFSTSCSCIILMKTTTILMLVSNLSLKKKEVNSSLCLITEA